jgi:hypothetical protein
MDRNGVQVEDAADEEGRLPCEPTRAEIAAACEALRKGWSQRRLNTRSGFVRWRLQSPHSPFSFEGRPLRIE